MLAQVLISMIHQALKNFVGNKMNIDNLADAIEKANHCGYNLDAAKFLRKQAEEIRNLKQSQSIQLDVIKNLEAQVYGGTTK
jgi:hypothetical protein